LEWKCNLRKSGTGWTLQLRWEAVWLAAVAGTLNFILPSRFTCLQDCSDLSDTTTPYFVPAVGLDPLYEAAWEGHPSQRLSLVMLSVVYVPSRQDDASLQVGRSITSSGIRWARVWAIFRTKHCGLSLMPTIACSCRSQNVIAHSMHIVRPISIN
jgi:hypothetical protein